LPSVEDSESELDPDPHVFGPPGFGSGSINQRYGSVSHKGFERTERLIAKSNFNTKL
jgi:hypothetical protein